MNTRHATRPHGATAVVLDLSDHLAQALAYAQENQPEEGWTKASFHGGPYALATAKDGTEYLIDTEGVGFPLDDQPVQFDVFLSTETSFSMFPSVVSSMTREEIHAAATGETVDLADHIRTFGARLDRNHHLWYDLLTKEAS